MACFVLKIIRHEIDGSCLPRLFTENVTGRGCRISEYEEYDCPCSDAPLTQEEEQKIT